MMLSAPVRSTYFEPFPHTLLITVITKGNMNARLKCDCNKRGDPRPPDLIGRGPYRIFSRSSASFFPTKTVSHCTKFPPIPLIGMTRRKEHVCGELTPPINGISRTTSETASLLWPLAVCCCCGDRNKATLFLPT